MDLWLQLIGPDASNLLSSIINTVPTDMCATVHDHATSAAGGSVQKPLEFVDEEHGQTQEDH